MNKDLQSVVLTEEQIQEKVKEAAAWLDERFADKKPLAVRRWNSKREPPLQPPSWGKCIELHLVGREPKGIIRSPEILLRRVPAVIRDTLNDNGPRNKKLFNGSDSIENDSWILPHERRNKTRKKRLPLCKRKQSLFPKEIVKLTLTSRIALLRKNPLIPNKNILPLSPHSF